MYSAFNVAGSRDQQDAEPCLNTTRARRLLVLARSAVAAALCPVVGGGAIIGVWRILFSIACFVRLMSWCRLLDDLQDSYVFIPAVGWEWLPPPSPVGGRMLCTAIGVCTALLSAGLLSRVVSAVLLLLCSYAAVSSQDPGSQLDSLILQVSFVNCLLPLSSCCTLGSGLRSWVCKHVERRQERSDGWAPTTPGTGAAPVRLWALVVLRTLVTKPYILDALAKLADGWNWLVRAQPAAQRLLPITRSLPGAVALPWLISWTSCCLDCVVLPLLLHRPTRYALGLPCIAVAQVLNYCMWGLDGWWLLLVGGWLTWAPPEAVQAAAAWALASFRVQPLHQELWLSPQRQQQQQQQQRELSDLRMGIIVASAAEGPAPLRARAWSSWFWNGNNSGAIGRQRRVIPSQQQRQQQQDHVASTSPSSLQRAGGRSAVKTSPVQTAAVVAALSLLAAYHLLSPLRFLAYPSRPAWTEEGLIAPWHRHLIEKKGWVYFVVRFGSLGGRVLDVAPEGDPMLGQRSATLVAASPAAALHYAARLSRVAAAAGWPIRSIRALSCFSLNGGPYRTLFDVTANLLLYARPGGPAAGGESSSISSSSSNAPAPQQAFGAARSSSSAGTLPAAIAAATAAAAAAATVAVASEGDFDALTVHSDTRRAWRLGPASGVSRWLHDYDTAPRGCDPYASPRDRPGLLRRSRADLAELQAAAGLWVEVVHDGARGRLRRSICWGVVDGAVDQEKTHAPCPALAYRQR